MSDDLKYEDCNETLRINNERQVESLYIPRPNQ